jgi:hypothetical protein
MPAQHFVGFVACQTVRAFVPIENAALAIHKVHTITHLVQQRFINALVDAGHKKVPLNKFGPQLVRGG